MKRYLIPAMLFLLIFFSGIVSAQTPEPTQTPYIIYVVVTATPEPAVVQTVTEVPMIQRSPVAEPITLVNNDDTGDSGDEELVTIVNTSRESSYATTVDDLIQRVVSTVTASTVTTAGGSQDYSGTGGAIVHLSDGSSCTMNFQLISEPTYPAGAIIPRGEVFWKEWLIQNIGTCTWTPEWEFVFDSGWQIGNTRFHMNRTTAPGETLNVRLAMVPDQKQDGNYYSTYAFEAPDGTRYGTITSSYTVKPASYFAKPTPDTREKYKPQHGRPAGPDDGRFPPPPPWPWPWW